MYCRQKEKYRSYSHADGKGTSACGRAAVFFYLFCFIVLGTFFGFFLRRAIFLAAAVDDLLNGLFPDINVIAQLINKNEIIQIFAVFFGRGKGSKRVSGILPV